MCSISINYTTSDGRHLVYVPPEKIPRVSWDTTNGFLFTLINPWYDAINDMMLTMMAVGLVGHWEKAALAEMRAKAFESGNIRKITAEKSSEQKIARTLQIKLPNQPSPDYSFVAFQNV